MNICENIVNSRCSSSVNGRGLVVVKLVIEVVVVVAVGVVR